MTKKQMTATFIEEIAFLLWSYWMIDQTNAERERQAEDLLKEVEGMYRIATKLGLDGSTIQREAHKKLQEMKER